MIYRGTTTCRHCGAVFTFKCFRLTDRKREHPEELSAWEEIPDAAMCYEYTDSNGTPHFTGECANCHHTHELYPAEARQIPKEFYSLD